MKPLRAAADAPPDLLARAVEGDATALNELLRAVQGDVYNLARRMLWCPEDAADATQEILLKIVTRLSSFRGDSAFRTWTFRVAANHLMDIRRSRVEREELTFGRFAHAIGEGLTDPPAGWESDPEQQLLVEEVKIGCTLGMLICLNRDERIAYILGEVFGLQSAEASTVLGISPAAFRKRLSRARSGLRTFMAEHCGLVNRSASCHCPRRVNAAVTTGRVRPENLAFAAGHESQPGAASPPTRLRLAGQVAEMEQLHQIGQLFRDHPRFTAPRHVEERIAQLLDSGEYQLLTEP